MCITISIMLEKLRLFLVVLEEGSLRRAADRLRISQSAITRQMQSLEFDLGGRVLERTSAGVRPTNGGHALAERAKTLLADYDSTMAEVRRLNRGESERLLIGYIASAVQEYLGPALAQPIAELAERTKPEVSINNQRGYRQKRQPGVGDCRLTP
jgi:DNA-binding transcriptional LysR family regulator